MQSEVSCTHTSLRKAARRLTQLYDDALAPISLTSQQALLLSQISELAAVNGTEGASMQMLALRMSIQISALTHALRPLVRDGLVEVRPAPHDRRTKRAVLTLSGYARLNAMYALWSETNSRFETALGADSAAKLRTLADRVASEAFIEAYRSTEGGEVT
ncbi:MarR family winged helix-turn-helix transcriptional regulator [Serratia ficaria]|uniref:MarR family winged helix-turn-helix transcriptional regulator n=1 Tax=Serratia ficaria TaxID=61651 RepID=UPI00093D8567|nr:MarR family transcriptional regulator [Serratia ficaria]